MKTLFKKMLVGALLAILLSNANIKVMAQLWNIPSNSSTWTTSNNFIGTNAGTPGAGDLLLKTQGATRMTVLGTTGQVGIGLTPVGNTSAGGSYFNYGAALQVSGPINNNVPAWSPAQIFTVNPSGNTTKALTIGFDSNNGIYPYIGSSSDLMINAQRLMVSNTMAIGRPFSSTSGNFTIPTGYNLFVENGIISKKMILSPAGITSLITTPAGYSLYVLGGILTEKVKVSLYGTSDWADFVFDKSYKLMPLKQVEKYIDKNKHLPDVPSAEEMVNNGLDVAKMDAKLLQKIEELTLYMIEMNKNYEEIKEENKVMKKEIEQLKKK